MPLRIIIADDHPMLVDGLKRVLEEIADTRVVACADNGLQLISILQKESADLVLLDLQMPKSDGIESLKFIKKNFPKLKVIVFTNYGQAKLIKEIKSLGADGFVLKDSTSSVLKEAVTTVAAGASWFKEPANEYSKNLPFMNDFMKKYQLTERETEIIGKIAEGLTSKEIASHLFVSEFTINTHRRNICRKLNIYTPAALVSFAKEHGLA
jgi:two-component system, NarL family, nitrate/nitrite response regulator NarL